ncbi:unnamed protein product, partial [Phaeothamnion confervicola]
FWLYEKDQAERFVALFYEFDAAIEAQFKSLYESFEALASARRVWHIEAEEKVQSKKHAGGANSKVVRKTISDFLGSGPALLKTNVPVPLLPVGKQIIHFLPDRLLVEAPEGFGVVSYKDLKISVSEVRFCETDGVPADAELAGSTWKYVNNSGAPDARFKNNFELPIAIYEEVHLESASGLNEAIQVSKRGFGDLL